MRPSSRQRVAAWLLALPLGSGGEECARRGRLEMISFWLLCWKLLVGDTCSVCASLAWFWSYVTRDVTTTESMRAGFIDMLPFILQLRKHDVLDVISASTTG